MLSRGQHAHTTVCHTLVNVKGERTYSRKALFAFIVEHLNSTGSIFTGAIVGKPKGEAMHYVGVGVSP